MKKFNPFIFAQLFFLIPIITLSQNVNQSEIEMLINKYRQTEGPYQSKKIIKDLNQSGVDYDILLVNIKDNINYSSDVKKAYIEWRYAIDSIEYLTILFVPNNYSPEKKYPVSFILHGAATTFNTEVVKLYVNKDSYNCDTLDRIVVYPGCWVMCPWWRERQTKNLDYLLNKIKQNYNVDENNIHLSGISDGGTGIIYQANLNVTPWASFRSYISNPGAMSRLSDKTTFIKNLGNRPFLFISSEKDELFPPSLMDSFLEKMKQANNSYQYILAPGYKHEISWMPLYRDTILHFYQNNPRTPYPTTLFWQTDNPKYGRNHWVIIDKLLYKDKQNLEKYPVIKPVNKDIDSFSAIIEVKRTENTIHVKTINVKQYTLLLSSEQFNFEKEIQVYTNGALTFQGIVTKDIETLLKWYKKDLDRTMLFGAELTIKM
ncbi:MAG TPA: hypothetical protein DCG75_11190 [Bacteroidales bacterium]|jgi:hypothetical protein|nr:hypothetical protein [Bacteroidales bacterium]